MEATRTSEDLSRAQNVSIIILHAEVTVDNSTGSTLELETISLNMPCAWTSLPDFGAL